MWISYPYASGDEAGIPGPNHDGRKGPLFGAVPVTPCGHLWHEHCVGVG